MFSVTTINIVLDFFVPLTGRSGSVLPPDLFIGGITAVLVCITVALVVRDLQRLEQQPTIYLVDRLTSFFTAGTICGLHS